MDPLTALAAIKTGVAAGKQLHNLSKETAGFFDATDGAKKAHAKKKNSIFASSFNSRALRLRILFQGFKTCLLWYFSIPVMGVHYSHTRVMCFFAFTK